MRIVLQVLSCIIILGSAVGLSFAGIYWNHGEDCIKYDGYGEFDLETSAKLLLIGKNNESKVICQVSEDSVYMVYKFSYDKQGVFGLVGKERDVPVWAIACLSVVLFVSWCIIIWGVTVSYSILLGKWGKKNGLCY